MNGRLELRQPPSDLAHLLANLDRGVVPNPDREQPQRPVAQLRGLDRRDQLARASIARAFPTRPGFHT